MSHSVRNSSVAREDKLLVMNGVGFSMKHGAQVAEDEKRETAKNKFASIAAQIEAQLQDRIFHTDPDISEIIKTPLSAPTPNTIPTPFKDKFSSYVPQKEVLKPKLAKPKEKHNQQVLNVSDMSSSSSDEVESSYSQLYESDDGGSYEAGGFNQKMKHKVPSIVPEEQSYEVTEGFIGGSFIEKKAPRTANSPSRFVPSKDQRSEANNDSHSKSSIQKSPLQLRGLEKEEVAQVQIQEKTESDQETIKQSEKEKYEGTEALRLQATSPQFQTIMDEESSPINELSIQKSIVQSVRLEEDSQNGREISPEVLPDTARFNPIPVQLIAPREMVGIKEDSQIISVEEEVENSHRKNQVSFGTKGDSPLRLETRVNSSLSLQVQSEQRSEDQVTVKPSHSPERDKAVQQILCEKEDLMMEVNRGMEQRRSADRSQEEEIKKSEVCEEYTPTVDQNASPNQKRVMPFNVHGESSQSSFDKSPPHPLSSSSLKKQRDFLIRNIPDSKKLLGQIQEQKRRLITQSDSESVERAAAQSEYGLKSRQKKISTKSTNSLNNNSLFSVTSLKPPKRDQKKRKPSLVRPLSSTKAKGTHGLEVDARQQSHQFAQYLKVALSSGRMRPSSSELLLNAASRTKLYPQQIQSMNDLMARGELEGMPAPPSGPRPSYSRETSLKTSSERRFKNSPYQSQWNYRVLSEIFKVQYNGQGKFTPVSNHSQSHQSLKHKAKKVNSHKVLTPHTERAMNPFSGAMYPRQSFPLITGAESAHEMVASDHSQRRQQFYSGDQGFITPHRQGEASLITATTSKRKNKTRIMQHVPQRPFTGKSTVASRSVSREPNRNSTILSSREKKSRQKLLISVAHNGPQRQNPLDYLSPSDEEHNLGSRSTQNSASLGGFQHPYTVQGSKQSSYKNTVSTQPSSSRAHFSGRQSLQGKKGGSYIQNNINININHNYKGANMMLLKRRAE